MWVTSSSIPMVKCARGRAFAISSKIPFTIAGVNSLDPRPYRPPMMRGAREDATRSSATASLIVATTSR